MLSKIEALEECMEMWNCLAENGSECKSSYVKSKDWVSNCVLCQYSENNRLLCGDCLVKWPIDKGDFEFPEDIDEETEVCQLSIFNLWNCADDEDARKKYALEIAYLAETALDEVEG